MKSRLGALVVSAFVCSVSSAPVVFAKGKAKGPDDGLALKYQSDPETPVEAAKLLSMWANAFDALLITDRFTSTDRKMTWAKTKSRIFVFVRPTIFSKGTSRRRSDSARSSWRRSRSRRSGTSGSRPRSKRR